MDPIDARGDAVLAPFFSGEGGYVHLLHALLTSTTPFAAAFRSRFSGLLQARGLPPSDLDALTVHPEYSVSPSEGLGQGIDLVLRLPDAIISIEAKVFESSFRQNQIKHQYMGLRQEQRESSSPIHVLLISSKPTHRGLVFDRRPGDRAENVTWDEVLDCCVGPSSVAPGLLLAAVVGQARLTLPSLAVGEPGPVPPEREVARNEVRQAIAVFNQWLSTSMGDLAGWSWKPKFSPRPTVEFFENGLTGPDGKARKGQYIAILLDYRSGIGEPLRKLPRVTVSFTLEVKGGNRHYRPEWDKDRDGLIALLPPPVEAHKPSRGGARVEDQFETTIRGEEVVGPDGRRLQDLLAELLPAYATAFGKFLRRHGRVQNPTERAGVT
jgi:hypothetical protein